MTREVLRVERLVKHFPGTRGRPVRAVDGVSFSLHEGETLALVGESGCGKSTLARALLRLRDPIGGRILFADRDITHCTGAQLRAVRRELQIVFQDPYASLNPRMRVGEILAQPLRAHGRYRQAGGAARVAELLELVGLEPDHAERWPHEFSGGQRQRIGVARALALQPRVLILDEALSALDTSIQAQIVSLLADLRDRLGLAYLLIAHDLAVVRYLADRVAVMYMGQIVEIGDRSEIYLRATHPYTHALLSAAPIPDPSRRRLANRIVLIGETPSPADPPSGCRFRTRCWRAQPPCADTVPELVDRFGHGHPSACFFAEPLPQAVADEIPDQ